MKCDACRGQRHSVRPQAIACMLPGMGHTVEDLAACDAHAASLADESLLSDAWQVGCLAIRLLLPMHVA